jgi:hypothetical protein
LARANIEACQQSQLDVTRQKFPRCSFQSTQSRRAMVANGLGDPWNDTLGFGDKLDGLPLSIQHGWPNRPYTECPHGLSKKG